ncbi:MAG: aldehyde dehydrogenase family protein [Cyclobacteriaceae bacterium]|nr:aldehyde dehydrogenase family protein [Cyclobacteriaceae bacterium]
MEIINPATEEVIARIDTDSPMDVQQKIEKLRKGQKEWAKQAIADRLEIIQRFGQRVQDQIDDLAGILTSETGKPLQQAYNEIKGANNRIVHLMAHAEKALAPEYLVTAGATLEHIVYEPLGLIANISAWNYPYNVGYNVFLYALVAGNAVCYKPSEYASLTGLKFRDLLYESGLPENVFECFTGGPATGEELLKAPLNGYFFTGSYATGKYIAERVAEKLVPVQLELGGKDPLYVANDVANVQQAAINAAEGAFYNTGQSCCAVERIYVHGDIFDEFLKAFVTEVKGYKTGSPLENDTFIGPLTRRQQRDVILEQVQDALNKGAILETGGKALEGKGYFMEPTVLTRVDHSMRIMREESFGPVIGIQKVKDDEEALRLMQDTEYGLTAAIYSSSYERAELLMKEIDAGTVYWNCCDRVSPEVPWSGRKHSGLGSTLSTVGIRAFTQPKAYHKRQN